MPRTEAAKRARLKYEMAHPERIIARRKAYYVKNGDRIRADGRARMRAYSWKKHGIVPTRPAPECCELCGKPPRGKGCAATLHADHDHLTGVFRGWLCGLCNSGIGKLGDSVANLKRAIAYLEKPQCLLS